MFGRRVSCAISRNDSEPTAKEANYVGTFIPIKVPREDIRKVMGTGLAELKAAVATQNIV
jgi:hypothetical protein